LGDRKDIRPVKKPVPLTERFFSRTVGQRKLEGSQLTQAHLKNSRHNRSDGAGSDVSIVIIIVVEYLCVLGRE